MPNSNDKQQADPSGSGDLQASRQAKRQGKSEDKKAFVKEVGTTAISAALGGGGAFGSGKGSSRSPKGPKVPAGSDARSPKADSPQDAPKRFGKASDAVKKRSASSLSQDSDAPPKKKRLDVSKAAAKGAVKGAMTTGEPVGATLGALKGAGAALLKPENRKKLIALLLVIFGPTLMQALLIAGMVLSMSNMGSQGNSTSQSAAMSNVSFNSGATDILTAVGRQTGVPWQILLATIYYESGPGKSLATTKGTCSSQMSSKMYCPPTASGSTDATTTTTTTSSTTTTTTAKSGATNGSTTATTASTTTTTTPPPAGVGPYQILKSKLTTPQAITAAQSLETSSSIVAEALSAAVRTAPGWSDSLTLLTGITFSQDGSSPTIDLSSQAAYDFRSAYVNAIAKLPLLHQGKQVALNVFMLAQYWAVGANPPQSVSTCGVASGTSLRIPGPSGQTITLDSQQLSNVSTIAQTANTWTPSAIPEEGIVIATMVGLQESSMYNLPNSHVPGSETNPNVQWGPYSKSHPPHNGTSVGVFQQQNNWGTVAQRMDVKESATLFFMRMLGVPNWQVLLPGQVAQDVQASGYPKLYTPWLKTAQGVVKYILGVPCTATGTTVSVAGDSPQAKKVIAAALAEIGTPYVWGGGTAQGPSGSATAPPQDVGKPGFDCSGLMLYAFAQVGVTLPHYSGVGGQYSIVLQAGGFSTQLSQLQPGDLVFFAGSDGTMTNPGHVGLYVGNGQMIQAPYTGQLVQVSQVPTGSNSGFVGGGPV